MRVSFNQGIISAPPMFLKRLPNGVGIDTNTQHVMGVISTGSQHIFMMEPISNQVLVGWEGIDDPDKEYWLFWDIDVATGRRGYWSTTIQPINSLKDPTLDGPVSQGQLWWDEGKDVYKERVADAWVIKYRLFAGMCRKGGALVQRGLGAQFGESGSVDSGFILYDKFHNAIKVDGKFLTTNDSMSTDLSTIHTIKLDQSLIYAVADEIIPRYNLVKITDENRVKIASAYDVENSIIALSCNDADVGDAVNLAFYGMVTNPEWNWDGAGQLVYVVHNGQITDDVELVEVATKATPIGRVYNKETIYLDPTIGRHIVISGGGLGEKGEKGDKGDPGPMGPPGPPGPPGVVDLEALRGIIYEIVDDYFNKMADLEYINPATTVWGKKTQAFSTQMVYKITGQTKVVTSVFTVITANAGFFTGDVYTAPDVAVDTPVTILASYTDENGSTYTKQHTFTVKAVRAVALVLSGPSSVVEKTTATYTAKIRWTDGTLVAVTPDVWTASANIGTIAQTGVLTAADVTANVTGTVGATYVEPTYGTSLSGSLSVTVTDAGIKPFYGVAALPTGGSSGIAALIPTLSNRGPNISRLIPEIALCQGQGQFLWLGYPKSYGLATLIDLSNGLPGGWDGAKSPTNGAGSYSGPLEVDVMVDGVSVPFYVYRTDYSNLGCPPDNRWEVK